MSDSAKGPLAGYLFQFERALLLLAGLDNKKDYISIESVDDIAKHNEKGTVILTEQAKHSISNSGTTFQDTSYALWRTIEIWIGKLEKNILNDKTVFVCSTNKVIAKTSLLYKIKTEPIDSVISQINDLLVIQKEKLKKSGKTDKPTIKENIKLIEYALSKESLFRIIQKNIQIEDNQNIKEHFFTKLHLTADKITDAQREAIFDSFYGWISNGSKAKWNNSLDATFSKNSFDDKWLIINSSSSIKNAIFRTKESLGSITESEINKKRQELFVKQIEDINRRKDANERKIKEAILDFLYSDIEIFYIINKGDFTKEDFENFLKDCQKCWQDCFDANVLKEIDKYTDDEKTEIAIRIFDTIMNKIEINFKDGFCFNTNNAYIRNGSFLKLSNVPNIGWHPEWEDKYKV